MPSMVLKGRTLGQNFELKIKREQRKKSMSAISMSR